MEMILVRLFSSSTPSAAAQSKTPVLVANRLRVWPSSLITNVLHISTQKKWVNFGLSKKENAAFSLKIYAGRYSHHHMCALGSKFSSSEGFALGAIAAPTRRFFVIFRFVDPVRKIRIERLDASSLYFPSKSPNTD